MELSTATCSIVGKRTRETGLSKIQKESSNEWAKEPRQYFLKEVQMTNKYTQKRAATLAIMEMQTKSTVRWNLTAVRMTIIKSFQTEKKPQAPILLRMKGNGKQ